MVVAVAERWLDSAGDLSQPAVADCFDSVASAGHAVVDAPLRQVVEVDYSTAGWAGLILADWEAELYLEAFVHAMPEVADGARSGVALVVVLETWVDGGVVGAVHSAECVVACSVVVADQGAVAEVQKDWRDPWGRLAGRFDVACQWVDHVASEPGSSYCAVVARSDVSLEMALAVLPVAGLSSSAAADAAAEDVCTGGQLQSSSSSGAVAAVGPSASAAVSVAIARLEQVADCGRCAHLARALVPDDPAGNLEPFGDWYCICRAVDLAAYVAHHEHSCHWDLASSEGASCGQLEGDVTWLVACRDASVGV